MKKITFGILFLFTAAVASAQTFKPFKVDLSTGYAIPSGKGAKGGILFVVEPKYAVIDNLSVGLRLEGAVMARGFSTVQDEDAEVDVKASASYLATADYYFTENTVRPFAGVGAGLFSLASASANSTGSGSVGTGSKFGGMLRAGTEIGHFRIGLEYNLVPTTNVTMVDTQGNETQGKAKNSYIGIKIGAVIGGGRISN